MWRLFFVLALGLAPGVAGAADARPIVGPGATKEEVLDAYGWPIGQTQAGTKEILIYPQGRVIVEKGRVERVDFSLNVPWPAPRPRPGAAGGVGVGDSWFTSWTEAVRESHRRQVRILALFTGSDWSPPSKQFLAEVAEHADFLTAFLGSFVLLKLDYPTRTTQMNSLRAQNAQLRERYEVTTYPALVVLEPDGQLAARVDLNKPQPGDSYRAQVIVAVRETRDALAPIPVSVAAAGAASVAVVAGTSGEGKAAGPASAGPQGAVAAGKAWEGNTMTASLWSAGWALTWGLGGGLVLVVVLLWWFWRKRPSGAGAVNTAAERVADAASGVPSAVTLAEWSHERLRAVVAAMAETDGYEATVRAGGAEGDLALARTGETQVSVIVACAPAAVGPVSAKRLRELFGTITLEEVGTGWFVGVGGFSAEAREYAQAHGLVLIGRDALREQMRALTERDLARVLARAR